MGWTGIPIKPSTILVFSVAFGISVDDTIHFLAKYRQELLSNGWNIRAKRSGRCSRNGGEHDVHVDRAVLWVHDVCDE